MNSPTQRVFLYAAAATALVISGLFMLRSDQPSDPPPSASYIGPIILGGVSYQGIGVNATRAQFLDAGFPLENCSARVISCQVRIDESCRPGDGGRVVPYAALSTKVLICPNPNESPYLIFRWPRSRAQACFQLAGPPDEVCTLVDLCTDGGTDCAEDPSGVQPIKPAQSPCACSQPDAGLCRVSTPDGGVPILAPVGVTLNRGTFQGPGCIHKACFEMAGPVGESWPQECPTGAP